MKALNITLSISFILLLLLNLTSCKKDKTEVIPTVTADDLLAYNLVLTVDLGQNIKTLRLITFSKVGDLTKYMYIQHGDVLEIYLPN